MSYFLRVSLEIQQHRRIDGRDVCRPPGQPSAPVDGTRAVGWQEQTDSEVEGKNEQLISQDEELLLSFNSFKTCELNNHSEKEKVCGCWRETAQIKSSL